MNKPDFKAGDKVIYTLSEGEMVRGTVSSNGPFQLSPTDRWMIRVVDNKTGTRRLMMCDLILREGVQPGPPPAPLTSEDLRRVNQWLQEQLYDLRHARCPECGRSMPPEGNCFGCEYDRLAAAM